jgi:hypothetical protein
VLQIKNNLTAICLCSVGRLVVINYNSCLWRSSPSSLSFFSSSEAQRNNSLVTPPPKKSCTKYNMMKCTIEQSMNDFRSFESFKAQLNHRANACFCFFLNFWKAFIFLIYTQWHCILSFDNSTAITTQNLTPYRDSNPGARFFLIHYVYVYQNGEKI